MYVKILKVKGEDMYKGLWGFMIFLLFFGCSSKKEKLLMQNYNQKKTYFKKLQKTEKILLSENNITKTVLTATYLYDRNTRVSDKDYESFIIGLYREDNEVGTLDKIFGLQNIDNNTSKENKTNESNETAISKYTLTVNGKKAISIKRLDASDARLKNLSFVTEWTTYALVKFKHEKSKHLKMVFKSPIYGKGTIYFSKVAKYIFMKKAF